MVNPKNNCVKKAVQSHFLAAKIFTDECLGVDEKWMNKKLTFQQVRVCEKFTRENSVFRTPELRYFLHCVWATCSYILQDIFHNNKSSKMCDFSCSYDEHACWYVKSTLVILWVHL